MSTHELELAVGGILLGANMAGWVITLRLARRWRRVARARLELADAYRNSLESLEALRRRELEARHRTSPTFAYAESSHNPGEVIWPARGAPDSGTGTPRLGAPWWRVGW